jgi:broad specificity phosphatase PhoE
LIYLVRHGRTAFNVGGRFQGHSDSPLTELGLRQASAMGVLLKSLIEDPSDWTLTASPLGRAAHTARIIQAETGLNEPVLDDRLREIGMGSWEGLTEEDIAMVSPDLPQRADRYNIFFSAPDGEGLAVFTARLQSWLDEALSDARPRVAVSHGIAGKVLRGLYLGLDIEQALKLDSPQDAIFRLDGGQIEKIDALAIVEP